MAVITGTAAGLFTLRMLAAHYNAAQALAERITDAQVNAKTVAMVISAVTALAPVSTTFIEWKWKLYRAGHGGVFHGIAELWAAFKKVLGRK
jgi:hypothetical protein